MSRSSPGDPEVAAIVLAAGLGRRFGPEPKLLAQVGGQPLVRRVAEAALGSRARPVVVVLGAGGDRVAEALLRLDVRLVANPRFAEGLSTSLKAGFAALPEAVEAAVVLLGDMPLVSSALVDALVAAWLSNRPAAVVPTCGGRRGNPVLLSRALEPEIVALTGDRGAGPLLADRADVVELPVEDVSVLADVDTPAALVEARRAAPTARTRVLRPTRPGSSR